MVSKSVLKPLGASYTNKSIDFANRSFTLAREIEDRRVVGEQLISLALSHRDLQDLPRAKDYCAQAIQTFLEIGLKPFEEKAQQLFKELNPLG